MKGIRLTKQTRQTDHRDEQAPEDVDQVRPAHEKKNGNLKKNYY